MHLNMTSYHTIKYVHSTLECLCKEIVIYAGDMHAGMMQWYVKYTQFLVESLDFGSTVCGLVHA